MKYIILILAFIFLIFFIQEIDVALLWLHLSDIGWHFGWILLVSFLAYTLASLGWLFLSQKNYNLKDLPYFFYARQVGEAFATINPTGIIGGDALKISILNRSERYRLSSTESVITTRVLTLLSHIFLILIVLCFIGFRLLDKLHPFHLTLFTSVLAMVFYILYKGFFARGLYLYRFGQLITNTFSHNQHLKKLRTNLRRFNYRTYKLKTEHPRLFLASSLLLMLHWILGTVEYFVILKLLQLDITVLDAFVIEIGTSCLRSLVSFVPGQIGFDEYGNKVVLQLIGVTTPGV